MWLRRRMRPARAVWAPSFARRVLRHRATAMVVALGIGTVAVASYSGELSRARDERDAWGETERVAVVTEPIAAGAALRGSVRVRDVPRALVPDDALRRVPASAVAKVSLHVGEVVLAPRVTESGWRGLPEGTVALTLSVVTAVPMLELGDLVDLWVVDGANFSSHRVAHRVLVLAASDDDVTVAVPHDQAAAATVASLRPVTLTLIG